MGNFKRRRHNQQKNDVNRCITSALVTLIIDIIALGLLSFDDYIKIAISLLVLGLVLCSYLIYLLYIKIELQTEIRAFLIFLVILISSAFAMGGISSVAQPRDMLYGIVSIIDGLKRNSLEVNVYNPNSKMAGKAAYPDDLGNFLISGLEKGVYWVILLNFTNNYLEFTEFIMISTKKKESPSAYPFPKWKYKIDKWDSIYFKFDSTQLSEEAEASLLDLANKMKNNSNYIDKRLLIHTHCCVNGPLNYNQQLGQRRAEKIRDTLINHGINSGCLIPVSYGELKQLGSGWDEASYEKNRRADFYFLPSSKGHKDFVSQNHDKNHVN